MKIFQRIRHLDGWREIYFLGIRILRYRKKGFVDVDWAPIEKYLGEVLSGIKHDAKKLIVIPSDPIAAYEKKGGGGLSHYNPDGVFDVVFILSPYEQGISKKQGVHIIGVDFSGNCYRRALELIKPDVVRAYGGYWATRFMVQNRTTNCPIISSVHDKRVDWLYDEIVDVDKVICVSPTVADLVERRGVSKDKIILKYDCVDRNLFSKVKSGNSKLLDKNYKNIVCVARLSHEKNQETIIRALSILGSEYHCTFIGQGDAKKYQKLAKKCGVLEQVAFIPRIANTDLPAVYSDADCMCLPTLSEGFGVVFIEAAATQCPVIASDIEPMNLYLKNNESAILVKEYTNPAAIAQAIKKVCEDKDFAKKLGKNGRAATLPFDSKKVEKQEADIYLSLINNQK